VRWNRVVPALVERMAAQQSTQRQPRPAAQPEALDGLDRVGAARRRVPTGRRERRADRDAIEVERLQHGPGGWVHGVPASRANAASRSRPSRAESAMAASGSARTTTPDPDSSAASLVAICARSRRTTRCRTTLPPTERPTTNPTRGGPSLSPRWRCTTRHPRRAREPERTTALKSDERRIRLAGDSTQIADECRLGRQFAATLAAASGDDGAAGTRTHAQPEAVRLSPAAVVRLKGALAHGRTLSYRRSARPRGGHVGVTCSRRGRRAGTRPASDPRGPLSTVRIAAAEGQTGVACEPVTIGPPETPFTTTRRHLLPVVHRRC
jgi:hypothetical protein